MNKRNLLILAIAAAGLTAVTAFAQSKDIGQAGQSAEAASDNRSDADKKAQRRADNEAAAAARAKAKAKNGKQSDAEEEEEKGKP